MGGQTRKLKCCHYNTSLIGASSPPSDWEWRMEMHTLLLQLSPQEQKEAPNKDRFLSFVARNYQTSSHTWSWSREALSFTCDPSTSAKWSRLVSNLRFFFKKNLTPIIICKYLHQSICPDPRPPRGACMHIWGSGEYGNYDNCTEYISTSTTRDRVKVSGIDEECPFRIIWIFYTYFEIY